MLPEVPGKEEISPAQLAKISDFSSTDLGRKVWARTSCFPRPQWRWGTDMTAQIAEKCGGK